MKISKIIFISLLSIIGLYILASILYIRIYGYRKDDKTQFTVKKELLPTIKVIYVNNSKNIEVFISDSSLIKSTWHKDYLIPKEIFTVKNDTLMLSDIKGSFMIKIYANDSLKSIIAKETDLSIESVTSHNMDLNLDKSKLYISLADSNKHPMKELKILAKNKSSIRSGGFKVNLFEVTLQNSTAYVDLDANKLKGTLSDSSTLNIHQPYDIGLKSDTTSNIYMYSWD